MMTKLKILFLMLAITVTFSQCVTEFVPEVSEQVELLVIQGVLTDSGDPVTIKLSTSIPLGQASDAKPLSGCVVTITDDAGSSINLIESVPGTYLTGLHGIVGRTYTLHVRSGKSRNNFSYESFPMKMLPVPAIDSVYYKKKLISEQIDNTAAVEECQIYLDTHDPTNACKYFRWNYSETWKLRLRADVPNQTCWVTNNSDNIFIRNTTSISEDVIKQLPVKYISKETDRLWTKYSILVNQYSINEDEFNYWEKLQKVTEQVGGLYDIIPSSIPGNMVCIENPDEKVLGYFSVSAISSKRIFISEKFSGIVDPYARCAIDTIYDGPEYIEGLGKYLWLLFDIKPTPFSGKPRLRILTDNYGCSDCTVRGSTQRPDFWVDDK
jgi:hypothetical protein